MKSSVNEATAKNCPTCSRPLPSGAPAGLCPACLLAQGAETESGGGQQTRFVPPSLAEVAALFPQLEILRLLGAGGMGAVYQARQPALARFVALKVLPAGGDGANFEERFNREARALARLNHPNIVAVHEFGRTPAQTPVAGHHSLPGLHYFLMEFVDGANLRQLEQAGRLSPREALQIIPQICDALQYAHDEGVVHRDIKPENVLVDRKGRVKIADFGLAKILGHDPEAARLTVEGQVMGTPHYMAPEQVERPLAVDHRADIYSLGVVFYEMLTGDLPLGKFAPPSRKVQVDVRLDEIVLRALENDPARRYQQASEVKSRVATVVETPGETSKPTAAATDEAEAAAAKPGVRYLRWLGVPAVVERDGEREVNFQGALGVFFVMLMTSALVQPAVRWGTGTEYATPQLGFVTAVLMAIWAIRRTMNQPWDDAPRRAANGTVILPPTKRRRYVWDGLMVVGLVAFVVGIHFFKTQVINPRLAGNSAVKAAQVAHWEPATGTSLVRHPAGGTVELLGIADPDSATNGWWRADGTQTPFALSVREVDQPAATNAQLKNLVLRFNGLGRDTVERIEFESSLASSGRGGADEVIRDGTPLVTDAWRYLVSFPAGLPKTKIRIAWGTGDWQTALSMAAPIWRESPQEGVFNSQWRLKFVGLPAKVGGELQVSYLGGHRDPLSSHRLVAIDQQGREHSPNGGTGSGTGGGAEEQMVYAMQFSGLELEDVKEFRLQTRPIQWVEFSDVALNPRVPLPHREALRLAERTNAPAIAIAEDTIVSILTPDWRPADDAEVALVRSGGFATLNREGFNDGQLQDALRVQTYNRGRFRFSADNRLERVFAVHASGFAEASPGQLIGQTNWTLQPWGRIEGRWASGDQPVAGREVALEPLAGMNVGALRFDFNAFKTETDRDGRFHFAHVPPGRVKVTRLLRNDRGNGNVSWGLGRSAETAVRAGEVSTVALGVGGYRLSGKLVWPASPTLAPHWRFTGRVHTPVPQPPDAVRGNQAELKRWQQTPEQQRLIKASIQFPLSVLPDNSLYAEEIDPGTYTVDFFARVDHFTEADGKLHAMATAAPLTITVPPEPATGTIDLGVIVLRLQPAVTAAEHPSPGTDDNRIEVEGLGRFPSVQAALDAAPVGGTVRLGPGVFRGNFLVTKPVKLVGASWEQTTLEPATPWRPLGDQEARAFADRLEAATTEEAKAAIHAEANYRSGEPVVRIRGATNVSFTGIRFRQPGTAPEGRLLPGAVIEVSAATVTLRHCALVGATGNGLIANEGADVVVERCLIAAAWNSGIRAAAKSRLTVTDSDLRNCHYAGIVIARGADAWVSRSRISGAAWHGIRYDDASPEIAGNLIFGHARSGIYASGRTKANVRGNVFFANEMNGLSCWFNNADEVTGNTFSGNFREALSVLGASTPLIASNIFLGHPVALFQGQISGSGASATNLGQPVLKANLFWNNGTNWLAPTSTSPNVELPPSSGSLVADPGMPGAANSDFTFAANSPARAAGIGALEPLPAASPFPLQPEELAIIPDGATRDSRQWKRPAQP